MKNWSKRSKDARNCFYLLSTLLMNLLYSYERIVSKMSESCCNVHVVVEFL